MLIQWMSYATLIGALIAAAAFAIETIAAIWGGSRRWVWVGALIVAAVTPLVLASRRAAAPAAPPVALENTSTLSGVTVAPVVTSRIAAAAAPAPSLMTRASVVVRSLDRYFIGVWGVSSVVLLLLLVRAATTLQLRRKAWAEIELEGERVLIAADVGPAVIGTLRPRIVIPDWALALDSTARELMLRHEREHIRARDPQLVLLSVLSLALFPWNAALWMIVRRLRLTIEMDCDGRVLRAANRPREYGLLLLTVGARQSAPFHLAASLAERRPLLERRIRAMTTLRPAYPKLATTLLVVLAAGATTAATRTPHPAPLVPARAVAPRQMISLPTQNAERPTSPTLLEETPTAAPLKKASVPARLSEVPAPGTRSSVAFKGDSALTTAEIRALIERFYPSVLGGDETIGRITFVVDANRHYVMSQTASRDAEKALREVELTGTAMGGGRAGRGGNAGLTEVPVGGMPVKQEQMKIELDSERVVALKKMLEARQAKLENANADGQPSTADAEVLKKLLVEATARGRSGGGAASADSARVIEALLKARLAVEMDKSQLIPSVIDPTTVDMIQTMKIGPGGWAPAGIAVVVVHLKP